MKNITQPNNPTVELNHNNVQNNTVSIITLNYNGARYLEECIRSIMEQDYPHIEWIMVDNGSTDESLAIAARVLEDYPNRKPSCKILLNGVNRGVCYSTEKGFHAASGEWLLYVDSDDWLSPEAISLLVNEAKATECDILSYDWTTHIGERNQIHHCPQITKTSTQVDYLREILSSSPHDDNCIGDTLWSKLFKLKFMKQSRIKILPNASAFNDIGMVIQLYCQTTNLAYLHKPLYHYRLNPHSATASWQKTDLAFYRSIHEMINNINVAVELIDEVGLTSRLAEAILKEKSRIRNSYLFRETPMAMRRFVLTYPETDEIFRKRHYPRLFWRVAMPLILRRKLKLFDTLLKVRNTISAAKSKFRQVLHGQGSK